MSEFSDPPTQPELAAYAATLHARAHESQLVPFMQVNIAGAPAMPNNCHENANLWVEENPTFTKVHGWLFIDGGPLSPIAIFLSHSVVADPSGNLYDLTPLRALEPRPFLPALISDDDFAYVVEVLVKQTGKGTLVHRKNP